MNNRESIRLLLNQVTPEQPGFVVIHSSLFSLLENNQQIDDILFWLSSLKNNGYTIALPAFTFSYCSNRKYHWLNSSSETGSLADLALRYFPDAKRTPHPFYSFVTFGSESERLMSCQGQTAWGGDTPFEVFEKQNATIVMLGCGWGYNTIFHRYEELAEVPYRYHKHFDGVADFGAGEQSVRPSMYVRDLALDPKNNFAPVISALNQQNKIKRIQLWRGVVESASADDICNICTASLKQNPYAFVANEAAIRLKQIQRNEADSQPAVKIAILSYKNNTLLEQHFSSELTRLIPERQNKFLSLPYGQLSAELLNPRSNFHAFSADVCVFSAQWSDLLTRETLLEQQASTAFERYIEQIQQQAQKSGCIIVHTFYSERYTTDLALQTHFNRRIAQLNERLISSLEALSNVHIVDMSLEMSSFVGAVSDSRLSYSAQITFSDIFSQHLATVWSGIVIASLGKRIKVIVTDLDHTLWGGVLGDEGAEGLLVGSDYPGNVYRDYQKLLKDFRQQGVLLCIASKNNQSDVEAAFRTRSDFPIQWTDFSATEIHWDPKWQSLQRLSQRLNIGLSEFLFIDDNPAERQMMRQYLPAVKIFEFPDDVTALPLRLKLHPSVVHLKTTDEDRRRVVDYEAQKHRAIIKNSATSLTDYYRSLGMTLFFTSLDETNLARAEQLCMKTNQFNMTTQRFTMNDLLALQQTGHEVIVIGLQDQFIERENVGLLILKREATALTIQQYLLSCRVLGRGIETLIPRWLSSRAKIIGCDTLVGKMIPTDKNLPAQFIYPSLGFETDGSHLWRLKAQKYPMPDWIQIIDNIQVVPS